MKVQEITEESTARILLAKSGIDQQLSSVRLADTALFCAHSLKDSIVVVQHGGKQTVWELKGNMGARIAFNHEVGDKLRDMSRSGELRPGHSVEYFRRQFYN